MKGWNKVLLASILLSGVIALGVHAEAVLDNDAQSTAQLELRANQAFNRGEYNTTLPILKKLAITFAAEPGRVGPVQEKIRVCERALASLQKAGPTTLPAADIVASEVMAAESRKPHVAPKPGAVLEMSIKELGNFTFDQDRGGNIPADVKALSRSTVRLRGYMIPMDQAENITQFALVPGLFCCAFGQPPQIQHTVVANCPKGKAVGYFPDEIVVEGTLSVGEKKEDGYIVSIFEVDVKSVKAAPK